MKLKSTLKVIERKSRTNGWRPISHVTHVREAAEITFRLSALTPSFTPSFAPSLTPAFSFSTPFAPALAPTLSFSFAVKPTFLYFLAAFGYFCTSIFVFNFRLTSLKIKIFVIIVNYMFIFLINDVNTI